MLAQLQSRAPLAFGAWQTQKPVFAAPLESRYWPPSRPPVLLQTVHVGTSQGSDAWGVTPAGHATLAVDGIR